MKRNERKKVGETVDWAVVDKAPTVTDEMVERACKKYAFREDGATWPDAYSENEVRAERVLMLEMGGVLQIVPFYDIQYVEVDHNYVTVHGKQAYTVKKTLAEIERELDERFVRTSRSFVVNLSFVRRISRKEVFLTDGTALPLSRGNYEKINRKIIEM